VKVASRDRAFLTSSPHRWHHPHPRRRRV